MNGKPKQSNHNTSPEQLDSTEVFGFVPLAKDRDPHQWLEEIESEEALAWVKCRSSRTLEQLSSDPRYDIVRLEIANILYAKDRLPLGTYANGYFYNFWQNDTHVRGQWRRTTLESYG